MNARDLPQDVLTEIFGFIEDVEYRRLVLPLVCKPWAAACQGPSPLWRHITIDAAEHSAHRGDRLRWAKARKWLLARAVAVEELVLEPKHSVPASGLAPLWAPLGRSLKRLTLNIERELPESRQQDDLADMCHLSSLQSLTLTGPAAPSCKVSAALAAGIAPLTQLQELNLKLQANQFTMLRPDLPAVLLGALVNLRVLDLDLASFAPPPPEEEAIAGDGPPTPKSAIRGGNMLPACITRLTKLEDLRLAGDWRRPKVALPDNFAALVSLRKLALETLQLAPPESNPSGYTPPPQAAPPALRELRLDDCSGNFPFGSGFSALRIMRLEACDQMHMAATAMQALREAKDVDTTVVIQDYTLEQLPTFLDGLPPTYHLTAKRISK